MLCLVGVSMLVAGFLYPGSQGTVASALIVIGAGEVSIGVLLPRLSEFEVGPGGFRTKMTASVTDLPLDLPEDPGALSRFAHLACGDQEHARELVEEALGRTRQHRGRLAPAARPAFTLRGLIELLDTDEERSWLRGSASPAGVQPSRDPHAEIVDALAQLEFRSRVAFLLRVEWALPVEDIARLLRESPDSIRTDLELARARLRPHVERAGGS